MLFRSELCDRKTTLSDLAIPLKLYPQYTKNVRVTDKRKTLESPVVKERFNEVQGLIGDNGRVLLRESGTEPVVRIMIECEDEKTCRKYADMISDAMEGEGLVCG